nr:isoform 2 of grainyhead-like protein 2 like [Quercus suber]
MFQRRLSQKPSDAFYKDFKANFAHLNPSAVSSSSIANRSASLADALDVSMNSRSIEAHAHELKDAGATSRSTHDPWGFQNSGLTPSMMDPNGQNFSMFSSHVPGYYTPTPGGTNTLFHSQAGDLHTPTLGMGLSTPLSLPTSETALQIGQHSAIFHDFPPHLGQHMSQAPFSNVSPFQMQQQQSFPPHHFTNQHSFEPIEGTLGESPVDEMQIDLSMHQQQPHHHSEVMFPSQRVHSSVPTLQHHPSGEHFRYHVTLNAPTAMIKHPDEIPITYLNKGQAYTLNVVDTRNQQPGAHVQYRTFVRVSFEDEQQREKPAACWQLWKEGRGTNEAHQRGGRLQAVEYVESGQGPGVEDPNKPRVELESASFDGFCVTWSPSAGAVECPISVRFNFLSTDFSHSKGVKGIPVRLCTKTEILTDSASRGVQHSAPEVCYCKVKLFRDHGAERKLSNDVAHVKKTIDKLNQQIAQIESGTRDSGKRKRGVMSRASQDERPGKMAKHHRRTWSMSSVTSNGARGSAEEDLHTKLSNLQDMFTSTKPASILYLRGDEQDDPDLHPVKILGDMTVLARTESGETTGSTWDKSGEDQLSSISSPTASQKSLPGSRRDSTLQQPTPIDGPSRANSNDFRGHVQPVTMELKPHTHPTQLETPPEQHAVKVKTRSLETGTVSGWIEALGVDPSYKPPSERLKKPLACFYIQHRFAGRPFHDTYYRAIYLTHLSLKDFVSAIARKCDIEPSRIQQTVRVNKSGLHILFDDDCIRQLPEGQDMTVEITETRAHSTTPKAGKEWDIAFTDSNPDGDLSLSDNVSSTGYELKLLF